MIAPIPYADLTPDIARAGCFVADMPESDYHPYAGISKSGLDLIRRSPAHYQARESKASTRPMEIGRAIHCALFDRERFERDYVLAGTPNRTCSEYRQLKDLHGAEYVLTQDEGDHIAGMQRSIYANAEARRVLESAGWSELSAFATDPETGALIRCRFDWITANGEAVDLKKTRDAREWAFSRAIYEYRYHVQQMFYGHVYRLITGDMLKRFALLAVEDQPPFANVLYDMDATSEAIGAEEMREDLAHYAECYGRDHWPAYEPTSAVIGLPAWVVNRYEDEQEVTL